MSSHGKHEWPGMRHDRPKPILFDRCDRCEEQAEHPLQTLDLDHVAKLWDRMVAVEFYDEAYRSTAEARAGRKLYEVALFLERYTHIDPRRYDIRLGATLALAQREANRLETK